MLDEKSLVQIHSPTAGIYKSFVQTGDEFRKGDILCEITDPLDGSIIRQIAAPLDGIVFFRYNRPLEFENTVLYKIIPI